MPTFSIPSPPTSQHACRLLAHRQEDQKSVPVTAVLITFYLTVHLFLASTMIAQAFSSVHSICAAQHAVYRMQIKMFLE